MTNDTKNIYQWVFELVASNAGLPAGKVIMANQNEPRPQPPYASILFINPSSRFGFARDTQGVVAGAEDDTFKIQSKGMRKTLASINVFGDGALDRLGRVRDALDRTDVCDYRSYLGIGHLGESEVRDLTELLETKYEIRAQMDLNLSYTACSEGAIEVIESLTFTPTVNGKQWPPVTVSTP